MKTTYTVILKQRKYKDGAGGMLGNMEEKSKGHRSYQ